MNQEVDGWDDISEIIGVKNSFVYDEEYLYFTHFEVIGKYPESKIGDFETLAKEYAKDAGVKNYEVFKWNEFGFFD
jgi:hypothetical protein